SPYSLLHLPRRVRGLQMPHVELVDMKVENKFRRGVHLLSQRLEHLLRTTIDAGHQAILLLNRRGYSNFVYCASCQNAVQCKYCDATMTYHRSAASHARGATLAEGVHTGQLHCHYCLAVNPLPGKCDHCGKLLSLFGLGTQRVEEEIQRKFPDLKFARVDSDSMHSVKDYEALLGRFAKGEVQVMLGTQMIAKGLDYPNVTLVGVISGDTALALPDFRAAERTFQLITQVAGRAGRGDAAGRVILQTFLPDDPTIQAAIRQDFVGFAKTELKSRRDVGLPPFARMVRIVMRDQDQQKLHKHSEELAAKFTEAVNAAGNEVRMKGPMPCAISRIAGYHRSQLVMTAASATPLQKVLATVRQQGGLARNERIAVDVDPVSLL
ncbi:MAG: priA, partial [Phycisphaerales bacterium]|nr:priA [Phycisphaerales bacterium]